MKDQIPKPPPTAPARPAPALDTALAIAPPRLLVRPPMRPARPALALSPILPMVLPRVSTAAGICRGEPFGG